jgi:DNA-binding NarL/FixJ family response regulator
MTTLALIDRDSDYRTALERHIRASPHHMLAASFASVGDAVAAPAEWRAPIVLIDFGPPHRSGAAAIRRLLARRPDLRCVVLTRREDDTTLFGALAAGAAGYLLKSESPESILAGLDELMAGGVPLSRPVARRVLEFFHRTASAHPRAMMTPREADIIGALARGRTSKEIARQLGLSPATVKNHLNRIYEKLGVRSRTEAVVRWLGRGK